MGGVVNALDSPSNSVAVSAIAQVKNRAIENAGERDGGMVAGGSQAEANEINDAGIGKQQMKENQ